MLSATPALPNLGHKDYRRLVTLQKLLVVGHNLPSTIEKWDLKDRPHSFGVISPLARPHMLQVEMWI